MNVICQEGVGSKIQSNCSECKKTTNHIVLSSARVLDTVFEEEDDGRVTRFDEFQVDHQIVQCLGCNHVGYRREINSDNWEESMIDYFPRPSLEHETLKDVLSLPRDVHRIYIETIDALTNGQRTLAGVGIRLMVEMVCKEKGAVGHNLQLRIDELVKLGVIVDASAKLLHRLRDLGNDAAHEAVAYPKSQLLLALDIVQTMLKNVYIFPRQAEIFKKN
jgi:hypothetical protein